MSEIKHTPGPWKRNHLTVSDQRGMVIAQVSAPHPMLKGRERNEDMEGWRMNARLISAAPEMLETLDLFVKQWNACGPNSDFGRYFANVRDAAVAAIAKATEG